MAFTEFYVQTTADNLNAGSTTDNAAVFTYAGGTFVRATGVFTVASGNPLTDGVAVGDFVSIYTTSGATVATFVARVTARDATTITVSLTAIAGATSTVSEAAGAATCKVGGAWKGPNAAVSFPFDFILTTLTNASGNTPRVNFKSGTTYSVTAAMTHSKAGPIRFESYYATIGDGAMNGTTFAPAIIDGGSASALRVLSVTAASIEVEGFVFTNDAGSGGDWVVYWSGQPGIIRRCVIHDCRAYGLYTNAGVVALECEFYSCNKGNNAGYGAHYCSSDAINCIYHNNTGYGLKMYGESTTTITTVSRCIFDSNSSDGLFFAGIGSFRIDSSDFYANGGDGIDGDTITPLAIDIINCNFIANTGYGVNGGSGAVRYGRIINCGFGAGTQANGSGTVTAMVSVVESGSITYANDVTPWVDPANGDFRVNLATAINAGRGAFIQTAASYAGAIGYPVIGACQVLYPDLVVGGGYIIGG